MRGESVRMLRPAQGGGGADRAEGGGLRGAQKGDVGSAQRHQRVAGGRRKQQDVVAIGTTGAAGDSRRKDGLPAVLGDDNMRVRTAEAIGAHTHDQRLLAIRQGDRPVDDLEPQIAERDSRVGGLEMEIGRHLPMTERQQHLREPGHAGRRLEMPDVRLDRADQAPRAVTPRHPQHSSERIAFDRVSCRRAGPVRLDIEDTLGRHPAFAIDLTEQGFLGLLVRQGNPVRAAIRVRAAADDHRPDRVAIAFRVGERLQHDDAASLGADVAVTARIEAPAAPGPRQHGGPAESDGRFRLSQKVDGTDEGQGGFARPQAEAALVQRNKRRGAGGIDRDTRAMKIEEV